MTPDLGAADRVTLVSWRVANVLGWAVLALALALVLRTGYESATNLLHRSLADSFGARQYWEYAFVVSLPSSVLAGVLIGSIVGARIYRWPIATAVVVTATYGALLVLFMYSAYVPTAAWRWVVSAPVAVTIPVAMLTGRRVWLGRPRALRRGA
jgi:hypothetical protein